MADADDTSRDLTALIADLQRLTNEAHELTEQTQPKPGTELVPGQSANAEAIKTRTAVQRAALISKTDQLKALRDKVEERVRAELHAAYAAMEPMRKEIKRLEEVVWTVNLYLGRDEEITTLLDGDPAPAGTPICIRQMVLSMDEETTIAARRGGMDFRDLTKFDQWITDPKHLQQVLPEPRGVVVLVPRRRGRDYGDLTLNSRLNDENRQSYWLIRNGDRLFRMSTDFPVGDRLTPTRAEFQSFFTESRLNHTSRQFETVPLEPGSSAWLCAEEAADARRRHYMRAALILQGLIERTTVFAPLPAPSVSLLRPESYDAGHVQLICDAENAITAGRQPFYEWLAEHNQSLRPGMRIVGAFDSQEFRDLRSRETHSYNEHERLRPLRAEDPAAGTPYTIEDRRDDGALIIRYDRTEKVAARDNYGYTEYRSPHVRASCALYPHDKFLLPIDLVTVEDMTYYLDSRTERHAYLHMLPLLMSAIDAKQAEHKAEAPFRQLLAAQIATTHQADPAEATAAVADLVTWWKHTTWHYRALISGTDSDTETRALKAIVAEFAARRRAAHEAVANAERDARMVDTLRTAIPDAMFIARTRDGTYTVFAPQPRDYPEAIAVRNLYVREFNAGRTASTITSRDWTIPTRSRLDKWTVLWASATWESWDLTARKATHLIDPEIDELINYLRRYAENRRITTTTAGASRTSEPAGTPIVLSCSPDPTGRAELRMYLDSGTDLRLPECLLTEAIPAVSARMIRLNWHRGVGKTIEHDISTRIYEKQFDTGHPWDADEVKPPWHDETVLWSSPQAERLQKQARQVRAAQNSAVQLRAAARETIGVIADAWESRAEQVAYARFLDDYHDPDLWEGHRKTVRGLRFPYHQHHGLIHLIHRLTEDNHEMDGHTVATVATLLGEDIILPDDILGLPLTIQPTEETT